MIALQAINDFMSVKNMAIAGVSRDKKKLIYGECIFMFMKPSEGFHKFHRFIRRIFGSIPQ